MHPLAFGVTGLMHNGSHAVEACNRAPRKSRLGSRRLFRFFGIAFPLPNFCESTPCPCPLPRPSVPTRLTAKDFEARRASIRPRRPGKATQKSVLPQTAQVVQERHRSPGKPRSPYKRPALTRAPATVTAQAPAPVALPTKSVPKAVAASPRKPSAANVQKRTGRQKLFVLDTNVLAARSHVPVPLRGTRHLSADDRAGGVGRSQKGMTEVARNARQTSRTLDALAGTPGADITAGFTLDSTGHRDARGKLMFQTEPLNYTLPTSLPQGKADNQILGVVEAAAPALRPSRSGAGVQRHQHARQGACLGPGHRRLPERQDSGRRRPAVFRLACPALGLLGHPWTER